MLPLAHGSQGVMLFSGWVLCAPLAFLVLVYAIHARADGNERRIRIARVLAWVSLVLCLLFCAVIGWKPWIDWLVGSGVRPGHLLGEDFSDLATYFGPGLLLDLSAISLSRRRTQKDKAARCSHCGDLLKGLTGPRCPECGTPFDPALLGADGKFPGE